MEVESDDTARRNSMQEHSARRNTKRTHFCRMWQLRGKEKQSLNGETIQQNAQNTASSTTQTTNHPRLVTRWKQHKSPVNEVGKQVLVTGCNLDRLCPLGENKTECDEHRGGPAQVAPDVL